jgi:polyferredoxin
MAKLGRPLGLVRYDTEARLRTGAGSIIRPRIFVYGALLTVIGSLLLFRLGTRVELEGQLLRGGLDVPYSVQADGRVLNHLTLRVQNKGAREKRVMTDGAVLTPGFQVIMPGSPYPVAAESVVSIPIFISFPQTALVKGTVPIELSLTSDQGEKVPLKMTLLGPG